MQNGIFLSDWYSPTAAYETVKILLSIITQFNLEAFQIDVCAVFLYGNPSGPIYMYQPEGFDDDTGHVCLLTKSIYGLRQASKCCYQRLHEYLKSLGFQSCPYEKCLYYSF